MAGKTTLLFNSQKFSDFVDKLQDLTNISDIIKLKIDSENILAYSMMANDVAVLSLKNYLLSTSEYITNFSSDKTFDYVIIGSSKFVKNLRFFNPNSQIKLDINYKENSDDDNILHVRSANYSNGKLKISCIGGELSKIRDINKSALESRLDIKNSKWGFKILKSDFSDIKKLSNINSEDKIINVIVNNGKVSMVEEYKWDLEIDEIDSDKNVKITFNKKYLSNINDQLDEINFKIFETFILVKDNISNLMMAFETDFSTDDE